MATLESLGITADKIRQYDQRIPRYTSYPTAPIWRSDFSWPEWQAHLEATSPACEQLSLYVHVPFCEKHCLFCACNVIITPKKELAEEYLGLLAQDIALMRKAYRGKAPVAQLHWGGGTPNYLSVEQSSRLVRMLEEAFPFDPSAERSIEVDPRLATPERINAYYSEMGFRRISFGVQDFHDETQAAIGRDQTRDITFENVAAARAAGFRSVNIDLIYGLPRQTEASWRETLDAIVALRPDRIALYNFAFLPTKLAHQRALSNEALPEAPQKLQMFIEAHNRLTAEGWEFIGMDHYARKDDSLTKAQQAGTLRRNFMGYNTLRGSDMIAFGTSAISDFQGSFAQNTKKLSTYRKGLGNGQVPVENGLILSLDDQLRKHVIEELMCNGVLRRCAQAGFSAEQINGLVEEQIPGLTILSADDLLQVNPEEVRVTTKGRVFLRNIAVLFDQYVQAAKQKNVVYSKAV
jgi:oxygen-independent coproporphyrinogen-3 oxidase